MSQDHSTDLGFEGRLEGRVAIVTGAGQGLGRAIADVLSGAGAAVALLGRTEATINEAAAAITSRGGRALALRCDVTDETQVHAAVDAVLTEFGGIDALVNNAQGGNIATKVPTAEVSDADIFQIFTTGAMGTLHMMRACFAALRGSGRGSVVNFGSGIGVRGAPGMAGYAMTKEAIGGLTKVAALEWGKHQIRVNQVCPAADSPSAEAYRLESPERWERIQRAIPLRRMGDPHADIGRAVLSLVGDDLAYLTGATLMLDGGQVLMR